MICNLWNPKRMMMIFAEPLTNEYHALSISLHWTKHRITGRYNGSWWKKRTCKHFWGIDFDAVFNKQAWHARDKRTGKEYVIKTVDISKMSKKERDASRKEVQILGTCKLHPVHKHTVLHPHDDMLHVWSLCASQKQAWTFSNTWKSC